MSGRDYRHREPKKTKQSAKKLSPISILPMTTAEVEVVKKKRKERKEEAEEEEEQ